jgi:hypothetical protein
VTRLASKVVLAVEKLLHPGSVPPKGDSQCQERVTMPWRLSVQSRASSMAPVDSGLVQAWE